MSQTDWMWVIVGSIAGAAWCAFVWAVLQARATVKSYRVMQAYKKHRYLATDMDTSRPRWKRKPR